MWNSALIEMRLLHRVAGWPMLGAALVFTLILRMQEPSMFLSQGVPFFWPSIQALICSLLLLLPWVWSVSRGAAAGSWLRRHASRPLRACLSCWIGICLEGLLLLGVILGFSITVKRMLGDPDILASSLGVLRAATGVLLSSAALAPGLSLLGLGTTGTTLLWLILIATSLGVLGWGVPLPLDRLLVEPSLETEWTMVIPPLAATVAGLLLSWALLSHRKP